MVAMEEDVMEEVDTGAVMAEADTGKCIYFIVSQSNYLSNSFPSFLYHPLSYFP